MNTKLDLKKEHFQCDRITIMINQTSESQMSVNHRIIRTTINQTFKKGDK